MSDSIISLAILLDTRIPMTNTGLTNYVNKLVALQYKIEDIDIESNLREYVGLLKSAHIHTFDGSTELIYSTTREYLNREGDSSLIKKETDNRVRANKLRAELMKQCEIYKNSKKPEWQILAEKNGWKKV